MYLSDYETYFSLLALVNSHSFEGVSPKHVSPSWPDDHSTLGFNFSELTYGNYFKTWLLFRAHIQSANNIILTIFGATCSGSRNMRNLDSYIWPFQIQNPNSFNVIWPWGVRLGSFINVGSICAKCSLSHCHSDLEESPKWVNFRLEMGEFSVQIWGETSGEP